MLIINSIKAILGAPCDTGSIADLDLLIWLSLVLAGSGDGSVYAWSVRSGKEV